MTWILQFTCNLLRQALYTIRCRIAWSSSWTNYSYGLQVCPNLNKLMVSATSSAQYSISRMVRRRDGSLTWGTITGIGNSSDRANTGGSKSLKFTVTGSNQYSAITVDNPAIGAGKTVTLCTFGFRPVPILQRLKPILYNASYQAGSSKYI